MLYIGAQDQYYTFTMFDVQAMWAVKYVLGQIKVPGDIRSNIGDGALDVTGAKNETANGSLNVVMKGQSLNRNEKKLPQDDQASMQVFFLGMFSWFSLKLIVRTYINAVYAN